MNITLVSEFALAGLGVTYKLINYAANAKFERVRAMELAIAEHPSDDILNYEKAKHDLATFNVVSKREKKDLAEAIKQYKKEIDFDGKKSGLYKTAEKAVSDFKASLHYDEKLLDIEKDMEDSIAAFKASVNYDETIEALDAEISEATKKWEAQEKLYSTADDNVSEMALKLKHAAEDAKNETIKKAREKKDALEKQLAVEKERFEKKKRESVRSMEEKITKEKRRLDENTTRSINDLEKDLDKAKDKLADDIRAQRTPEEADCVAMAKENEELIRVQDANNQARAMEIANDTSNAEQFAWWLKEHKWSKGGVIFAGFLPFIPAGYLAYRYGKFVLSVAKLM